MINDELKTAPGGVQRIQREQPEDLRDWSARLGVSPDKLKRAIDKVGPNAEDVRRELCRGWPDR